MKIFRYTEQSIDSHFTNESRFFWINHPNIISIYDVQSQRIDITGGCEDKVSYIIMELAPFGDFADLMESNIMIRDEKLIRTYFHSLINAIEYLNQNNVCHLDIKPENILIGQDYQLKLIDFDHAFISGDKVINGGGTQNYRAPELIQKKKVYPKAVDIYSAGIILFCLKSGILPYSEGSLIEGFDLRAMLIQGNKNFWRVHECINSREPVYTTDFKELVFSMTTADPKKRATISDVKDSKWYRGPIYTSTEMVGIMSKLLINKVFDLNQSSTTKHTASS